MSRYIVEIKPQAQEYLKVLSESDPKAYKKALVLIADADRHRKARITEGGRRHIVESSHHQETSFDL